MSKGVKYKCNYMEEELLLISLSNTTVKCMMYNGGGAYNPMGIQALIELTGLC